jgi:hypothetical protein
MSDEERPNGFKKQDLGRIYATKSTQCNPYSQPPGHPLQITNNWVSLKQIGEALLIPIHDSPPGQRLRFLLKYRASVP